MTSNIRERAYHDVERTFETTAVHRLAQIDRLYDPFEGEIDPVTVTATDPETGEKVAHFELDERANATDLMEASTQTHVLSSGNQPVATGARAEDFAGVTLDEALGFIEAQLEDGYPIESKLKAWTKDDGSITKLGVVAPT